MQNDVQIPAGMKAWAGGDRAPDDWDGGPVLYRNGDTRAGATRWFHASYEDDIEGRYVVDYDIIAYTPRTPDPVADEARAGEVLAAHSMSPGNPRVDEAVAAMLAFREAAVGLFDALPQTADAKHGPEPSLRQMVRFYYVWHGQVDPDADTEQYFAALASPPAKPDGREAIAESAEIERYQPHVCHCGQRFSTGAEMHFHRDEICPSIAAAKIIDPDAWHNALPQDGCGEYWSMRRTKALAKADAILALTPPAPDVRALREALERIERFVSLMTPLMSLNWRRNNEHEMVGRANDFALLREHLQPDALAPGEKA